MRSRLSFPTTLRRAVEVVFDVLEARTTVYRIAGDVTALPLPRRAIVMSLGALAVPMLSGLTAPDWMTGDASVLVWMTALIPAFLMSYHKGWSGASLALILGMGVLTLTQVIILVTGLPEPNWAALLVAVVVYIAMCLALGQFSQLLHDARQAAEREARSDILTGLPNRRQALSDLEREGERRAAFRGREGAL